MSLFINGKKYNLTTAKWRGFWSVVIHGFPGTVVDCGIQRTIGEDGIAVFRFIDAGTYTFVAEYEGEVQTKSITLVEGQYFMDVNMYVGYTLLEYIESTGTQYIDTGIKLTPDDIIKSDFYCGDGTGRSVYGCLQTTSSTFIGIGLNINYPNGTSRMNEAYLSGIFNTYHNQNVTTIMDKRGVNINGVQYNWDKAPTSSYITFANVYLFCTNTSSGANYFSPNLKVSTFEVYNKIHLITAKRISDNKPGMLDLVSGQFFTNDGTGEFIAGPVKE